MQHASSVSDASDRELGHQRSQDLAVEKLHADPHPSSQRSLARSVAIVVTCTACMLINTSNATSVSISLPFIGRANAIQQDQLQWLLSAYSLSSGCLLLFFGRVADLYGRKRWFLVGMLWQAVFALGIGFSNNGITMDVLRGFQGIGAAASIPSALGILAHSFPPSRARSIAFATFAAGAPTGGAFGNIMGGVLTQLTQAHWRSPFFLTAGFSALTVLGGLISFDPDTVSTEVDARLDWIGAFLVTIGLVLIVFVFGQAPIVGWQTPYIIACLVIGVIFVAIFVAWEHHLEKLDTGPEKVKSFWTPPPLMKLSIWTRAHGRMSVILAIAFLTWCGFISWILWVQLYYQNYLGLTPVLSMVRLLPMFFTGLLCNYFVAMVAETLPLIVFIMVGTLVTGFACVLFALIDPSVTYWAFAFPSTNMVVFGADFVYAAGTIFVAKIVFPHEQSVAGGLFQTMTQIGTAFGLTITTIVFNSVVDTQSAKLGAVVNAAGTNVPKSAELQGYRSAHWASATFPFLAALLAAVFLRKVGIIGHGKDAEQDSVERTITEQQADARP